MRRCVRCLLRLTLWLVFVLAPPAPILLAQATGTVRGDVLDQTGATVEGAVVIVMPLDGAAGAVRLESAVDGTFRRDGLDAGLYAMRASWGELGSEEYRIRVRAGGTVDVHFRLQSGLRRAVRTGADAGTEFRSTFEAGVTANRDGAYRDAVEYFARATELDPMCLECRYNEAIAHTELEAWAEAERAFRATLALDEGYVAAYYGLSLVYARSGRPDEAASARTEANRLAMASLAARQQRAADDVVRCRAFYDAGTLDDARRIFERATVDSPNYADAHYWLGRTLADLDELEAAAVAFRRYLSLDAGGQYADDVRARLVTLPPDP